MMEYFIDELTTKGKISHGSTFNGIEAGKLAADIQLKSGNPVNVKAEFIESNQIEDDSDDCFQYPLTAEELFKQSQCDDHEYDLLPSDLKRVYESCAVAGNKMIARFVRFTDNSEVIDGGAVEAGSVV